MFPNPAIFDIWVDEVWRNERADPPEMCLVALIKEYNIPKDKFKEVVEKVAAILISEDRDLSNEEWELPNADIIYTFDNEIINAYYRRENPVVPD